MTNPNQCAIDALTNLKDMACILIFTRDDANAMIPENSERGPITDDEWSNIVHDFNNTKPNDYDWEDLKDIVERN